MRLLGRYKLNNCCKNEGQVDKWLNAWVAEVKYAHWGCTNDLLLQYPKAKELGNGAFRFEFADEEKAVDLLISFSHKTALIINIS